jgi:hypothetical protein
MDLKPLLKQLTELEPSQNQELEILKSWFISFLESIDGIDNIKVTYSQSPWSLYRFSFEYCNVKFYATTDGKTQIALRDRNTDYYLHFYGDSNANYFKLALSMAFSLKQAGKI